MMYDTLQQGADCQPTAYLERVGSIADEAERAATYIEGFINRCRGGGNVQGGSSPVAVPSGHFGQLSRLADAVASIDKLARELQAIG